MHAALAFGLVFVLFGLIDGVASVVVPAALFTAGAFRVYLVATEWGFV